MSDRLTGRAVLTLADCYYASYWGWSQLARWAYLIGFVVVSAYTLWLDDVKGLDDLTASNLLPVELLVLAIVAWFALLAFIFGRMSGEQKQIDYDIDRERIVVHDATGAAVTRPWSQVKACHEHGSGFALRMRPMGSHWLVKRAFASAELQAFRDLAHSILGGTARLRNKP